MVVESGQSRYSVIYVSSWVCAAIALDRACGTDEVHSGSGASEWPAPAPVERRQGLARSRPGGCAVLRRGLRFRRIRRLKPDDGTGGECIGRVLHGATADGGQSTRARGEERAPAPWPA